MHLLQVHHPSFLSFVVDPVLNGLANRPLGCSIDKRRRSSGAVRRCARTIVKRLETSHNGYDDPSGPGFTVFDQYWSQLREDVLIHIFWRLCVFSRIARLGWFRR
ncbi:hypothetical protein [Micromonospora sp. NBC_00858]|uniref:hypothetical protein n=1 Tax=Micromonospora sp. NBC_00858 TaxID=2975979 RepID=UPI00386E4576|nr:hypothetical protein OG990_04190 [Micromonospora sp. NBC_00858]